MDNKIRNAVSLSDEDLEEVVGGLRTSRRVRATGTASVISEEDPLNGSRLICPHCGNVMSKNSGCTSPLCINNTNMARA